MRYTDEQLWDIPMYSLGYMKTTLTFYQFCEWSIDRLQELIEESTKQDNWMDAEEAHLRNYRAKAVKFYEQKVGR